MEPKSAVLSLSQGEKVKAGLIWASQGLAVLEGMDGVERSGGIRIIRMLVAMIENEVGLAKSITQDPSWDEIPPVLERAAVMMDSGVPVEANTHLSTALSKTTGILQRAMTYLREKDLA